MDANKKSSVKMPDEDEQVSARINLIFLQKRLQKPHITKDKDGRLHIRSHERISAVTESKIRTELDSKFEAGSFFFVRTTS
ncbi:MAG: hypothetical protein WCA07_11835 [Gloeobacterales cyanobacterium]|jgi:hypothetical protein